MSYNAGVGGIILSLTFNNVTSIANLIFRFYAHQILTENMNKIGKLLWNSPSINRVHIRESSFHKTGKAQMHKLLPKSRNKINSPILNQSILIGRVMPSKTPYEKAARFDPKSLMTVDKSVDIRVPYNVYDEYYKAFYEHQWDFVAEDPTGNLSLQTGDTVLIKRLEDAPAIAESISLRELADSRWWEDKTEVKEWWEDSKPVQKPITHHILEKIYSVGDVKDPISGEMVVGETSRSDLQKTAELYGDTDDANERFSYEKAPRRGWQEGKRSFTRQKTYKKWNVFKKDDKYGLLN